LNFLKNRSFGKATILFEIFVTIYPLAGDSVSSLVKAVENKPLGQNPKRDPQNPKKFADGPKAAADRAKVATNESEIITDEPKAITNGPSLGQSPGA
jgi:hypothetical protein